VATPVAAEGMGLTDRVNVMIGTDTASFADAVIEAHQDEMLWNGLSKNGLAFMQQNFSYVRGLERLGKLIDEICVGPEQSRRRNRDVSWSVKQHPGRNASGSE
jgi:hypothetical protein